MTVLFERIGLNDNHFLIHVTKYMQNTVPFDFESAFLTKMKGRQHVLKNVVLF